MFENQVGVPSKSLSRVTRNNESRTDGERIVHTCCLWTIGSRKKEGASCNICKQKGQLDKACREKSNKSLSGGKNQSLASVCAVPEYFEVNNNEFVIDSGSNDQIVFDRNLFVEFRKKSEVILTPNGKKLQLKGVGKVLIEVFNEKRPNVGLQLEDVL